MDHQTKFEELNGQTLERDIVSSISADGKKEIIAVILIGEIEDLHYRVNWRYAYADGESTTFNSLFNAVNFYNGL